MLSKDYLCLFLCFYKFIFKQKLESVKRDKIFSIKTAIYNFLFALMEGKFIVTILIDKNFHLICVWKILSQKKWKNYQQR